MSELPPDQHSRISQRVAELEMQILYQQREFSMLNEVVVRQQRTIHELQQQLATFSERMKYWQHAAGQESADEEPPPPHY